MIRFNSFNTALPMAEALAAKGQALLPVPGSLLSELISESVPPVGDLNWLLGVDSTELAKNYGIVIGQLTEDKAGAPSDHSLMLGSYVDQLAKAVSGHLAYAKGFVRPQVTQMASELRAIEQRIKASFQEVDVKMESRYLAEILKDDSFLDSMRNYNDRTPTKIEGRLDLGSRTNEEVRTLMTTGHQRTDELIVTWLSRQPANFPIQVWNTYFNTDPNVERFSKMDAGIFDVFQDADFTLGAYLIANRIKDEVQETNSVSLSVYKNLVNEVIDHVAPRLIGDLKQIYNLIKGGRIIVAVHQHSKTIVVNGELYDQWIASGGKPETILGMYASNDILYTASLIDSKADAFQRKWQSYTTMLHTRNSNSFHDRFKDEAFYAFESSLASEVQGEEELNQMNRNRMVDIAKCAAEYLKSLCAEDLNDIDCIALTLVAAIRFSHTSSFQLLGDIVAASKANPNIDVRDAALIATINYIGDWLADMITLKK